MRVSTCLASSHLDHVATDQGIDALRNTVLIEVILAVAALTREVVTETEAPQVGYSPMLGWLGPGNGRSEL